MKKTSKGKKLLSLSSPWESNESEIWLASALSLQRNLNQFPFPSKLDEQKREEILNIVSSELLNLKDFDHPAFVKASEMSPIEKEFLYEHYMTSESFHQAHSGEGFIFDSSGKFLVSINMRDHIQVRVMDCVGELESSWNQLTHIEMGLGKKIQYAFSPRFGFLTSDPSSCGTALRVSTYVQVPALIHSGKIDEFLQSHREPGIAVTGLRGQETEDVTESIGDLLTIHNNYTLGLNEENILAAVRSFTTKLLVNEKSERTKLKEGSSPEMKDKVSRAYGVLTHSYQVETVEAMNAISLLKLGVALGWLKGVTIKELNRLFFNCRRAHLIRTLKKEPSTEEVPHLRAELVHKILKKAKLAI